MIVEMVDEFYGRLRAGLVLQLGAVLAVPFAQAAAGGGEGIVWIERQQNQFVVGFAFQRGYRFRGVGMPVAHGHDGARVEMRAESFLPRARRFQRNAGRPLSSAWSKLIWRGLCAPETRREN